MLLFVKLAFTILQIRINTITKESFIYTKDFNWEEFKQGSITVCCQTIEEEANFLQECENVVFYGIE